MNKELMLHSNGSRAAFHAKRAKYPEKKDGLKN
jgi:hypothetical protein